MKKFLSMALALVMSLSLMVPAHAADDTEADTRWDKLPGELDHASHEIHGDPNNKSLGVGYGESEMTIKVVKDERCDHNLVYEQDATGDTHSATCSVCKEVIINQQMCYDIDDDLMCDFCGRTHSCGEMVFTYKDNGDGTHNKVCASTGHASHVFKANEKHVTTADDPTHCSLCGVDITCAHTSKKVVSNSDLTHSEICNTCGATVGSSIPCADKDGDGDHICDTEGCTNELPCVNHGDDNQWHGASTPNWQYNATNNRHEAACPDADCNEVVWGACVDSDYDCTCDVCRNVKHTPRWVQNADNKTHTYKCGACESEDVTLPSGSTLRTENHADSNGDGTCDKCGFSMSSVGAPVMVAEVPAVIPMVATVEGRVTLPTNLVIKNHSNAALRVDGISLGTVGWKTADTSEDFTKMSLDTQGYLGYMGINLRGDCFTGGTGSFNSRNWVIPAQSDLPLNMAVKISPQDSVLTTPTKAGLIRFSLTWWDESEMGEVPTPNRSLGATDQENFNKVFASTVYTVTVKDMADKHYTIRNDVSEFKTDSYGYIVQLPDVVPEEGYAFTGWFTADGTRVNDNQKIDGNLIITPGVVKLGG